MGCDGCVGRYEVKLSFFFGIEKSSKEYLHNGRSAWNKQDCRWKLISLDRSR